MQRMKKSRVGIRAGVAVAALVAGSGMALLTAPPAQALCSGQGTAYAIWMTGAVEWGKSDATCDGDGIYLGYVEDTKTEGNCAYVDYREYFGGKWHYYPAEGADCSTDGNGVAYRWDDKDNNTKARARVRSGAGGDWKLSSGY